MTGGLLQIVTSGKQDIYLTIDPQITFFKKVYRRHTNFSLELKEFNPEQTPEYNNMVTFNVNVGDAIHRCYFEIDLPNLSFFNCIEFFLIYYNQKILLLITLKTKLIGLTIKIKQLKIITKIK